MIVQSRSRVDPVGVLLDGSGDVAAESAPTLLKRAVRIAAQHAIDQCVIDDHRTRHGDAGERIVEQRIDFRGAYAAARFDVSVEVLGAVGALRGLSISRDDRCDLLVVGLELDVRQFQTLAHSIQLQGIAAAAEFWAQYRQLYEGRSEDVAGQARPQFLRAFGTGAAARIHHARTREDPDATASRSSRQVRVDAHVTARHRGQRTPRTTPTGPDDYVAQAAGMTAGRAAYLGEPPKPDLALDIKAGIS